MDDGMKESMRITLNGQRRETASRNVRELIEELGLDKRGMAIELNLQVVPRSAYASTPIREGDRVEIIHMVGGG